MNILEIFLPQETCCKLINLRFLVSKFHWNIFKIRRKFNWNNPELVDGQRTTEVDKIVGRAISVDWIYISINTNEQSNNPVRRTAVLGWSLVALANRRDVDTNTEARWNWVYFDSTYKTKTRWAWAADSWSRSRVVAWLFPFSSLHISVVEVAVVVTPETGAESSRAVVTTWPEFVR